MEDSRCGYPIFYKAIYEISFRGFSPRKRGYTTNYAPYFFDSSDLENGDCQNSTRDEAPYSKKSSYANEGVTDQND